MITLSTRIQRGLTCAWTQRRGNLVPWVWDGHKASIIGERKQGAQERPQVPQHQHCNGRCLCCNGWLGRRWLAEKVEVKLALKSGNFRGLVGHWFWVLTRANGESSDKGKWRKCSKASQVQKVDGWCRLTSCWFVSRLISHFAREGHHTKKQHNKVDGYARVFLLSGMMQHTTSVFFCWLLF